MPENTYYCPVEVTITAIGGKWKCVILWWLRRDAKSFGELKQLIPGITPKVLTQQLRELEETNLIGREAYKETPRRVEYYLTPYGETLNPITELMCEWGKKHRQNLEFGYSRLRELQVLIVTELDLSEIKAILEARQVQIAIASSVSAAAMQFQANPPDILIVDLEVIGLDASIMQQIGDIRQTPAIALTKPDNVERRQALRAGFQVHLTKPLEIAELIAAIASLSNS